VYHRRFGGTHSLHLWDRRKSQEDNQQEEEEEEEEEANFYQTTRRHIPDYSTIQNHKKANQSSACALLLPVHTASYSIR
jgi:hypothetical protein